MINKTQEFYDDYDLGETFSINRKVLTTIEMLRYRNGI